MKNLASYWTASDREHVRRILEASYLGTMQGLARIDVTTTFLKEQVRVDDATGRLFQQRPSAEREGVLSELLWRITCHLDQSETVVLGKDTFELGFGFQIRLVTQAERPVFVLTVKTEGAATA